MHDKNIAGDSHTRAEEPGRIVRNRRNASIWILVLGLFFILLALLSASAFAFSGEVGTVSLDTNSTLQNQRIFCWGGSTTDGSGAEKGERYPDHLGRLLGREVNYALGDTEAADLGAIGMFDEDRDPYGIIIYQFRFEEFEYPWGKRLGNIGSIIRNLQETGAVVVAFETQPIWNLSGQPTALDYLCYTGTSKEKYNPDIVKVNVGNETRIKKYYEMWGETIVSEIAAEEGAYFIPAYEDWDCLDLCTGTLACCDLPYQTHDLFSAYGMNNTYGWHPDGASLTHIHPDLMGAIHHHNAMGYGVLAERIARYMVGWGLGEYAASYEEMARELPSLYSSAEARMDFIEEMSLSTIDEYRKMYEIAKSLEGSGYIYTARWILREKILRLLPDLLRLEDTLTILSDAKTTLADAEKAGVEDRTINGLRGCLVSAENAIYELDLNSTEMYLQQILNTTNWQYISTMFPQALEVVEALGEAGDRRAFKAKADYDRAVKAFGECDHGVAQTYLEMIRAIPEPVLLPIIGFILLPALLRRKSRS
jgi:hypothetical protein